MLLTRLDYLVRSSAVGTMTAVRRLLADIDRPCPAMWDDYQP